MSVGEVRPLLKFRAERMCVKFIIGHMTSGVQFRNTCID